MSRKLDLEIFCREKIKKKDDYYSIDLYFTFDNSSQTKMLIYNIDLTCDSSNIKINKRNIIKNFEIRSFEKVDTHFHLIASDGYLIEMVPIQIEFRLSY